LKECFVDYLQNKTRVLVTHKFESLKYVDYIYIFNKGQIIQEGTLETLQASPIFQEIKEKYNMINKQEEATVEQDENKAEKEEAKTSKDLKKEEEKKETPPEDKELLDKLMLDEDKEEGAVGADVWKAFFSYYGGWCFYFFLLIVMIVMAVSQAGSNFWLSYWSEDNEKHSRNYYFTIYTAFGVGYAVLAFLRTIIMRIQSVQFARFIHREMFSKIIRAPVNLFFDRVPTGRVLNRFSKDLSTIDDYLSGMFGVVTNQLFGFLTDVVVCIIVGTAWVFPLVMLFFYICSRLRKSFVQINREVTRLGIFSECIYLRC